MKHLNYLSKSDFKIGCECPAKLWYKKRKYPNTNDENEFLKYLAENGHLVGKIAQMCYPEGYLIDTLDLDKAAEQTAELLQQENVVIFEPLVRHGSLLARIDILIKKGNQCQLIEVKAKKAPERFLNKKGNGISADWKPYVADVAFQLQVAKAALSDLEFTPFLMLTDGDSAAQTAGLPSLFDVNTQGRECTVEFQGSDDDAKELLSFVCLREVSDEVNLIASEVAVQSAELSEIVAQDAPHPRPQLSSACAKCEYKVDPDEARNGFIECWGDLAKQDPHIFDLYKRDLLKGGQNRVLNLMISEERTGLFNVKDEEWGPSDKAYRKRQAIQIEYTRRNEEWIDPELKEVLEKAVYPLQFIDFEFDQPAIPHVPGMSPWGRIAFQWSMHRIDHSGGLCKHTEFLETEADDPTPGFLESLKNAIDLSGTVLVWSPAEAATLRKMASFTSNADLVKWIEALLDKEKGPILDMELLTKKYHFHPDMKGQTSIKKVFPVAWCECRAVGTLPECQNFLESDAHGNRIDPYQLLKQRHLGFPVADGTAAILAYHKLIEKKENQETLAKLRSQLLDYCKLDTLAMRIIWKYWEEKLGT